jgi:hypothetical protein
MPRGMSGKDAQKKGHVNKAVQSDSGAGMKLKGFASFNDYERAGSVLRHIENSFNQNFYRLCIFGGGLLMAKHASCCKAFECSSDIHLEYDHESYHKRGESHLKKK